MATGREPFTISLQVSMAFEDDDHYTSEDIERYLRECMKRFPGRIDSIEVTKGHPVDIPHADQDGQLTDVAIHRDTIRQASHFGWLYPNGVDLRDPDVYGEQPCGCGCETTAVDVREWRRHL
jgi:hypothetical protein